MNIQYSLRNADPVISGCLLITSFIRMTCVFLLHEYQFERRAENIDHFYIYYTELVGLIMDIGCPEPEIESRYSRS